MNCRVCEKKMKWQHIFFGGHICDFSQPPKTAPYIPLKERPRIIVDDYKGHNEDTYMGKKIVSSCMPVVSSCMAVDFRQYATAWIPAEHTCSIIGGGGYRPRHHTRKYGTYGHRDDGDCDDSDTRDGYK